MRNWRCTALAFAIGLAAVASCSGPSTPDTKPPAVDAVELSSASITLALQEDRQLTATPKSNGQALTDRAVAWSTSDGNVASVSTTGLVRGLAAGTATISATSESKSASASVTVNNPPATLSTLSPITVVAGSAQFTLTIGGSNFVPTTVINWNGTPRATTFVSSTQLTTVVASSEIVASGTVLVSVTSPAPGGGVTTTLPFTITAPNPAPTIASISPTTAIAGTAAFTLTVNGTGFVSASVVRWNDAPRATTFVSSTRVTAAITATDIAAASNAQVTVFTPTPGGGTSASSPFTIAAPGPLVLSTHLLTSTKFTDTLPLTVTRDGRTLTPALSIRTERRWLTETAVLSTTALGNTRIVTAGTGRAIVSVTAEGLTDSVVVDVTLPKPYVTALSGPVGRTHLGANDTIVVRGYAMHLVAPSQLFAASLGVTLATTSDSANLRVVTTIDPSVACTGRPAAYKLTPVNVDLAIATTTAYTRARAGELNLAVGAAQMLTGAAAACIKLAPAAPNARYLLAFVDSRRIKLAETSFEFPAPADVTLRVEDKTGAAPALRTVTRAAIDAPWLAGERNLANNNNLNTSALHDAARTSAHTTPSALVDQPFQACTTTPNVPAWAVYCRATPWTVGATFNYQPIVVARAAGTAHIIAVSPKVVAAVFDADQALLQPLTLTRIQATLDYMSATYMSVLQQYYKTTRPVISSLGSNQLVVMFEAGNSTNNIRSPADAGAAGGTYSIVSMLLSATNCYGMPSSCNFVGVDEIVIHETTHAYQFLWNLQTRAGVQPFGQTWSLEGGAALQELLAPLAANNVAWDANTSFESLPQGDARRSIGVYANGGLSQFTLGYRTSAAFFRYLIQRLVKDKGMTFNDALFEVQIGATEGWYGIGSGGVILGVGLVPRMRAKFGPSWDPVQAMLEWTMADAADDLTANPLFQDLTAKTGPREAGGVYVHNGFKPYAGITAGAGTFGETTLPSGNTGVFQLEDPSVGATVSTLATSSSTPITSQVGWLILRVR